ncbi:MAG TPA: hypothetical protein VKE24_10035, partial [Candidatus Acidoferrales bacterium]|nr:hypothetical protein [Candidatus Acidoferrales bacterium]
ENFLVAYPSGTGRSSRMPTWNSGNCCGYAMENKVDDVAFIRALIDNLEHNYSVDPRRIFVTGISNGGMMSYRIGCELADQIAAIAPVEGAQNIDCWPSGPVSVILFHGSKDRLVPFRGGSTPFQIGPRRTDNSVANAVAFWVKQDGCSLTPKHEEMMQFTPTSIPAAKAARASHSTPSRAGAILGPAAERAGITSRPPI